MSTITIKSDSENASVRIITMNRPEALNSFNLQMFLDLRAAFKELGSDKSVRAIVLTGAGRAFCAGADISEGFGSSGFKDTAEYHEGVMRDTGGMLNLTIFEQDVPIIAAINGSAVGIGATMTLPCDIRIAAKKAKYAFPFTRRGIVFDGAASWFLPRLVGFSKAYQWSLTGSFIDPEDGLNSGLFSELHDNEDVLPRALGLARDMAENCSPTSLAQNKQLLRASMLGDGALNNAPFSLHIKESDMLNTAFASADCQEGVQAFLDKRAPKFSDRG